jgi:hypothetical protein
MMDLFFMKNFESFFKSISFYQMISNNHKNLISIIISSLVLIFNLSTKCVSDALHNPMTLYSLFFYASSSSQNQT